MKVRIAMEARRAPLSTLVRRASRAAKKLGDEQIIKNSQYHMARCGMSEREYKKRYTEIIRNREADEDSGFEEPKPGDSCWPTLHKYPEYEDFDQQVFNILGEKSIPQQKRKVKTNTVVVLRDCPEAAEDIKEWSLCAKPTLAKANKYKRVYDFNEREKEMNRILLEGAAEIRTYPRIYDEDTLVEMWLDKRDAIKAEKEKFEKERHKPKYL